MTLRVETITSVGSNKKTPPQRTNDDYDRISLVCSLCFNRSADAIAFKVHSSPFAMARRHAYAQVLWNTRNTFTQQLLQKEQAKETGPNMGGFFYATVRRERTKIMNISMQHRPRTRRHQMNPQYYIHAMYILVILNPLLLFRDYEHAARLRIIANR